MEFILRRHIAYLTGIPEKKKTIKREKEKELTLKDKSAITRNGKRKDVFVLETHNIPLQDKKQTSYSGRSYKNYVALEKKGNLISKTEKEDYLDGFKIYAKQIY